MNSTSPKYGLPREERLRRRGAISELFAQGESGFTYPIRYIYTRVEGEGAPSVMFTVPKRFHRRANKRNLLRRRVKEAYRLNKELLSSTGLNIALIYTSKDLLEYAQIERVVKKILTAIENSLNKAEL